MWKDIIGYEGLYKINEYGDVFSIKSNKILSYFISNKGYKVIDLFKDGKKMHFLVHRLVAIHFIPNPNNLPIVLHRDNIKLNTHYSNLKWGTYSENNSQAIRDGINTLSKPDNRKEYEIYNDYQRIFCYGANDIIEKIGFGNESLVRNTLHRNIKIMKGNYAGFRLRRKVILDAIFKAESPIELVDVQRSALDEGGKVP